MIELCEQNNQPTPIFDIGNSDFWVIFKKDIYTAEQLEKLGLNDRQVRAVLFTKDKGKITNLDYQKLNKISERTASRELKDLVDRDVLKSSGIKGAGAFYYINQ